MRRLGSSAIGIAAFALALSACGQGSTALVTGVTGTGGASFEGTVVTSRAAVVTTDIDGDGRADLVGVDREGLGDSKCLRNLGAGTYADAPASPAWSGAAGLAALRDACDRQDDASLLDGLGVHRVGPGPRPVPFAVLHVGDGVDGVRDPGAFPALEGVEPTSGAPGALVALTGSGLAARGATPSVTFGGVSAQVLFAFPDYVLVAIPAGAPLGIVDVVLTRSGLASVPIPFSVVTSPDPVLTSISPSTVAVGTIVILHGENLGSPLSSVQVSFAGTPAERVLALEHAIVAVVPPGALSGPVTATVEGRTSNALEVTVGELSAPTITSLSPASGSVGTLVRISGADLFVVEESLDVTFGGVRAAIFGLDESALTVVVPTGALDGDVVVTVGGRPSNAVPFHVTGRLAPHVDAVEPSAAAAGEMITIRGTDLVDLSAWRPNALPPLPLFGNLRVTVGGKAAWFVLPTADGLKVLVPDGAVSGDLVVTVNGQASNAFPVTVN